MISDQALMVLILYQQKMFLSLLTFKENIKLIHPWSMSRLGQETAINHKLCDEQKMKLFLPDKFIQKMWNISRLLIMIIRLWPFLRKTELEFWDPYLRVSEISGHLVPSSGSHVHVGRSLLVRVVVIDLQWRMEWWAKHYLHLKDQFE